MFDVPVRDTTSGVDGSGGDDSLRRTGFDASRAATAVVDGGGTGEIGSIGNDSTEKKPASDFSIDDKTVLSDPTDPGEFGPITFQQRRSINTPPGSPASVVRDELTEGFEHRSHHPVVIAALGISCYFRLRCRIGVVMRWNNGRVRQGDREDTLSAR